MTAALNWMFTTLFRDLRFNVFTGTSNVVVGLYSITNCMHFIFNFSSQYFNFSHLLNVANELKKAVQITQISSQLGDWRSLYKFWFKCVIIPIVYMTANNIRLIRLANNANGQYLILFLMDMSLFAAELIANLHYALTLCTSLTFAKINGKLVEIMDEAHKLNMGYANRKDSANKMQQFCDLSDQLDCAAEMHYRCSSVSEQLQSIFNGSVTLWIINKQAALVTQLFMVYIMANEWMCFQMDSNIVENPTDVVCFGCTWVVLISCEFYVLTKACEEATNEVRF